MKGDCVKPKTNLVKLSILMVFDSRLSAQWKHNTFLSDSRMGICEKAFLFAHSNIGLNLDLDKISQIKFSNRGAASRHIFSDIFFELFFADAS